MSLLAIEGGSPVRDRLLPYGHQYLDEADVAAVTSVLRSDWLTTGPRVAEFEAAFAKAVGAAEAVAVSSGTAALHAALFALGLGPGDEVIVPTMTFVATANSVVYQGAVPVFADVDAETLLLDPAQVEARITRRTRAIIAVDYAGQACDYDTLNDLARRHGLTLVADACHALGGSYKGRQIGALASLNVFSFHPVKHITTGEGGMVTTDDPELASRMRIFRNHGITADCRQREEQGSWYYEMSELGYNYRITDVQCALGISQLAKLGQWVARRREIASAYDQVCAELPEVRPLRVRSDVKHAYHLYVVQLRLERLKVDRARFFAALRAENIGVNVHYIPVHLHPFYQRRFGYKLGDYPVAEYAYGRLLTLPIFPAMNDGDVSDVARALTKVTGAYRN
ncbi:MAG: UDP-4-amino-4,6-dideoxy-N-acetyl-beta-L-altrosamine transaminase [candidate division WOR-3 bacterium]